MDTMVLSSPAGLSDQELLARTLHLAAEERHRWRSGIRA